eukprot:jgi/Picre1/32091/NNA_007439.t1
MVNMILKRHCWRRLGVTFTHLTVHTMGGVYQRRHKYVKKCIGSMTKAGENKNFVTLSQAAQEMRVKKIDLLKIDIEGYEFDEIAGWSIADFALPDQVSLKCITVKSFMLAERIPPDTKFKIFPICYGQRII